MTAAVRSYGGRRMMRAATAESPFDGRRQFDTPKEIQQPVSQKTKETRHFYRKTTTRTAPKPTGRMENKRLKTKDSQKNIVTLCRTVTQVCGRFYFIEEPFGSCYQFCIGGGNRQHNDNIYRPFTPFRRVSNRRYLCFLML